MKWAYSSIFRKTGRENVYILFYRDYISNILLSKVTILRLFTFSIKTFSPKETIYFVKLQRTPSTIQGAEAKFATSI